MKYLIAAGLLASALPVYANEAVDVAPAQIDYSGFVGLTGEVAEYRQKRLIPLAEFKERAASKNALILDTRSAAAFEMGHIKGAINLPFSDFTDEKLRKVIGENPDREILIYCNNNFSNDVAPIALKSAPLALNIPTFINLYGYGYRNIYELAGSYDATDPQVEWVGQENAGITL